MDDEQALLNETEPQPRPSAAEAFAHLAQQVARMDDRMAGRMELLTSAVENVVREKQAIEIPDYTSTLGEMNGRLASFAARLKIIAESPAMQLTPESMGQRITEAAQAARETDRATIKQSQDLHRQSHADLTRATGTVCAKREQRQHMLYTGIGTALVVSLLWLVYPGWAASIGPRSWLWPEGVARRVMGEATLWDAGMRLMSTDNLASWQAIVNAADMARENRDTIAGYERAAAKAKGPVRCTIRIKEAGILTGRCEAIPRRRLAATALLGLRSPSLT